MPMDRSVAPGDDFFRYVNGTWLKTTQIPSDVARFSEFGRLDVLYNNAGLWYSAQGNYRPGVTDAPSPLLEENIWDRTINVNGFELVIVHTDVSFSGG